MTNKIQISCSYQNRQRIRLDHIELLKSLVERNDLKTKIIKLRLLEQNEHIEIIQLKKVLRRIKFIREMIIKINKWRLET